MASRVIPADHAGRDHSSRKSERSLSQLPVRLQSTVNETILQLGVSLRLLSKATKTFQGELEGLLDKCNDISNAKLENLLKTEFNMNELWQKVFARKWRPTRKNKRVLCENILQNCMIYLRSERIGRPNPENVLKTFGSLIVLDLFEFAPFANVIVFFHMGEITAGWTLLGCIIFERFFQVLASVTLESPSLSSALASLLGVKTFLTSYYIACRGLVVQVEGLKVYLVTIRTVQKGINAIFLLTPQAMLNAYLVFSKVNNVKGITTVMRIQIFVVFLLCFAAGASLTNLIQEADRNHAKRGYYKSMTQILLKENDQFVAALLKGGWNICHHMIVSCALGALVAKTSPFLWGSILIGFFLLINAMRYLVNKGSIRYYLSMGSSWSAWFASIVIPMIIYPFGVGLMPVSILRWHCLLGPTTYGFGWISSFLISSITLMYYSSDVFLWVFFTIMIIMYICFVIAYLTYLKPEARETFYWSKQNWKDILRTEWWDNPLYESDRWNDIHLIGDRGANYARMVNNFLSSDLPWDKLISWLKDNKNTFKNNPPTWLSKEWLTFIPKQYRDKVWDNDEYEELCLRLEYVEQEFTNSRFQQLLDDEEGSDNETLEDIHQEKEKVPKNDDEGVIEEKNDDISRTETNHIDEVNDKENRNNPSTGEATSSEEEMAVVVNEVIQEEQNELRQKVIENINKRRSSYFGSLTALPLIDESDKNDIPEMLKDLFERSETLEIDKIIEESKKALDNGLFDKLLGPDKKASADDIVLVILKAFLRQRNKEKKKDNISEGLPRVVMAAFFELIDEISDLILAFVFYSEAGDVLWAAHGMFVLIGLNRFVQFVVMLAIGQGWLSAIEALVGIKTITDTYRLIADGPTATRGGQLLSALRGYSLFLGIAFESFPQMMLQVVIVLSSFSQKEKDTNTGVLITQLVSVAISSASIGLSMASLHLDTALSLTIPGKEMHISAWKHVPRKGSRQTMVLLSLMGVTSLHIILAVFGFGALFSFA
eukprot:g1147.t1